MLFKPELNETAKAAGERVARVASRARRRTVSITITLLILGGLGYIAWTAMQQKQAANRNARPDLPVPVLAAMPRVQDMPVYLDGVGSVRALNNVIVRAQVDGKLIAVNFTEGQDVKKGDVLGEIDPVIYKAQYDQAVAKKAQDEATLANARIDLDRYTKLAASNSGSKQQADTQKALVAQLEAQVQGDQGAIDNTKTMLSYTKIVSPIDGRTGLRLIDEGNLVQANDTNGLVVITQIRPISVLFNLPQQQFPQVSAAFAKGPLPVDAMAVDGKTFVDRGTLRVIDNQMDQTTGTIRMKAEFPNANLQLWPGQFINVRVLVDTLQQVVVVPTAGVQRGPQGTFVYVVGDDAKVAVRTVTVAQQDDTKAVVSDGVKAQEQMVTTGFTRLSNGTRVAVQQGEGEPQPAAGEGAAPQGPEAAPPEGRRKREGADNTDGKERRRSENAPAAPSAKQ